ncbi:MAG: Gfo/Idh/MocA family oxidoreductase [Actinomycetota bacterium]|nr:Gfo/Idh/MocA family oxidoreductase [Actinomycetota bacterium]
MSAVRPPDPAGPVPLVVVGAGLIGRRHVAAIQESPHARLVAVVDPDPAAAPLADAAGVPLHATLDELLSKQETTGAGVVVATPNDLHLPHGLSCLAAGLPVLVEKPIAGSVADGLALVEAAEAAGVPLLVGHHRRHSPLLAAAAEVVGSGRLGPVVAVQGSALFYKPDDYFDVAPWRREPGGGPILINLVHEVDDLRAICGDVVAVQAMASSHVRGFAVEDTVAVTMRFASGALGTFLLSDAAASARSWEQTSGENPAYPLSPDEDCYLIAGTGGSLAVPSLRMRSYAGTLSWWEPWETAVVPVERRDPLRTQLEHFCDVVRGRAAPLVSGRDAVETLRVTLAVAEAARTGGLIDTR